MRYALLLSAPLAALLSLPAFATVIGAPVVRDGIEIAPGYQNGVELDRSAATLVHPQEAMHLEADVHAGKGETHGFPEHAFIPYLSISYAVTKEGMPTFHKTGLLYPMTSRSGPHYGASMDMAGPGTYHLSLIVSPPSAHGMIRHTDKASGVPDWFKPITAKWTFSYPDTK